MDPNQPIFPPIEAKKSKLLEDATFDELIDAAKRVAVNEATRKILATCPQAYEKLTKDLELETFIQECVIKHLETKLRAAKRIK